MKKLPETKTNEERKVHDPIHARYIADVLNVVEIFNQSILKNHEKKHTKTKYSIGKNVICSYGIHYFKDPLTAYYYRTKIPYDYTGKWYRWHDNGALSMEASVKNGKYSGDLTTWYDTGRKCSECKYEDGMKHGVYTEYHNEDTNKVKEIKVFEHGVEIKPDRLESYTDSVVIAQLPPQKYKKLFVGTSIFVGIIGILSCIINRKKSCFS